MKEISLGEIKLWQDFIKFSANFVLKCLCYKGLNIGYFLDEIRNLLHLKKIRKKLIEENNVATWFIGVEEGPISKKEVS